MDVDPPSAAWGESECSMGGSSVPAPAGPRGDSASHVGHVPAPQTGHSQWLSVLCSSSTVLVQQVPPAAAAGSGRVGVPGEKPFLVRAVQEGGVLCHQEWDSAHP